MTDLLVSTNSETARRVHLPPTWLLSNRRAISAVSDVKYTRTDTAVVVMDPRTDLFSPMGRNWDVLGASVTEMRTVENLVQTLAAAKAGAYPVFLSPHYFYPPDGRWPFNGVLKANVPRTKTFACVCPLNLDGFAGSGADWLDEFKPFIEDSTTNGLVLQLRIPHACRSVHGRDDRGHGDARLVCARHHCGSAGR
jgi:hypothetical protein